MIRPVPKPGAKPKRPRKALAKSRLKPYNTPRRSELHVIHFSGAISHDDWIRRKPCAGCKVFGNRQKTPTQAAHAISRGAGGRWVDLSPLCNECHRYQELNPVEWMWLRRHARKLAAQHLAEIASEPEVTPI